jgi:hypothetical protein
MTPVFYRCSGGDLIAGDTWLRLDDALALSALYRDEITAARRASDIAATAMAVRLSEELGKALHARALWRMAAGPATAPR